MEHINVIEDPIIIGDDGGCNRTDSTSAA